MDQQVGMRKKIKIEAENGKRTIITLN